MFDGRNVLELDGDHLDISFRRGQEWPSMTPAGSIKNYTFGLGDASAGPLVQLGLVRTLAEEPLDWRHVIDPPHFHGSDQFRVLDGGEWIVLVIGDRRGALPTIIRDADRETLILGGEYFRAADASAYAHPAGPKGIPAVNTSAGRCARGYLGGALRDIGETQRLTGTFGDTEVGPSVEMYCAAAHNVVRSVGVCATERFLVVIGGDVAIGDDHYIVGDMRIQRADAPMAPIVAGPNGCELTLLTADRRCDLAASTA
ncbi:hypothetical protein JMUB5695_00821 [Mycobacterium heckeshornense]|uniref:hypothetical protein n=1 Tax=Mycobacterium heckeshornense TaxID=110505 RepID=UPI001944BD78|nr:hypothetical protein [Mycobacterium heckeshornense]BCQ07400.1 hypothetical protein JMUB5695_00821 [Mycobacterium heckeshornense]